ncbi:MAG: FecR family protein [Rhodocyclaceae bacterium]|nr:FecR family protein [Rhodocyclaceae bacterium]
MAFLASVALAAGTVESISGNAEVQARDGKVVPLTTHQPIDDGATVKTGRGSLLVLRFDDGHTMVLAENTEFRVEEYRFEAAKPEAGNIVFSLLKGALRSITGLIGERNHQNFALRAPQATIGIRGTDFMAALANNMYVSVTSGSIAAANAAGTVTFAAGATGMVASSTALAAAIPATALPGTVVTTFAQLSNVGLAAGSAAGTSSSGSGGAGIDGTPGAGPGGGAGGAGAGGAGAAGAGAAAAGGISAAAISAGALAAAALAASASSSSPSTSSSTTPGTTGTTGTTGTR